MALSADVKIIRDGVPDGHQSIARPMAASQSIYAGSVACTYQGYLVNPSTPSSNMVVLGVISGLINGAPHVTTPMTSPASGATPILGINTGAFWLTPGTAGDALTQANVDTTVYLINETTVGATNGGGTRPSAGTLQRIGTGPYAGLVSVRLNPAANP